MQADIRDAGLIPGLERSPGGKWMCMNTMTGKIDRDTGMPSKLCLSFYVPSACITIFFLLVIFQWPVLWRVLCFNYFKYILCWQQNSCSTKKQANQDEKGREESDYREPGSSSNETKTYMGFVQGYYWLVQESDSQNVFKGTQKEQLFAHNLLYERNCK